MLIHTKFHKKVKFTVQKVQNAPKKNSLREKLDSCLKTLFSSISSRVTVPKKTKIWRESPNGKVHKWSALI